MQLAHPIYRDRLPALAVYRFVAALPARPQASPITRATATLARVFCGPEPRPTAPHTGPAAAASLPWILF